MERPQERRRGLAHIVGPPLSGNRLGEDVDRQLTLLARGGTEPRQRMFGFASVAEQRAQKPPIFLRDVDFGVQGGAQPVPEISAGGERLEGPRQMFVLPDPSMYPSA